MILFKNRFSNPIKIICNKFHLEKIFNHIQATFLYSLELKAKLHNSSLWSGKEECLKSISNLKSGSETDDLRHHIFKEGWLNPPHDYTIMSLPDIKIWICSFRVLKKFRWTRSWLINHLLDSISNYNIQHLSTPLKIIWAIKSDDECFVRRWHYQNYIWTWTSTIVVRTTKSRGWGIFRCHGRRASRITSSDTQTKCRKFKCVWENVTKTDFGRRELPCFLYFWFS